MIKKIERTAEERAFLNYIEGIVIEKRVGEVNITRGENGDVLPVTIANRIVQKVYDISPIYQLSSKYNIAGKVSIPYYDEATQSLTVDYADEFTDLESTSGKLLSIELPGFLAGVLTKVSRSLFYNSQFDVIEFIVNAMAKSIHKWLEKELINGTTDKITGLTEVSQKVTAASATVVTADELIDIQDLISDDNQLNAVWLMNRATRKAIAKLKDTQGQYLLVRDFTSKFGFRLLGKEVYTSSNMPEMEAGASAIYYGDFSGLAVKFPEKIEVNILTERYEDQHAIGILSWIEVDSKVEDTSKIAKLEMSAE